ncbi:MAG: NUDIX domain-containing protein [Alphaproteobacteria bacterium]|nr:NUDIX domain-containing protein [Alphaproteobacteria bacterium]
MEKVVKVGVCVYIFNEKHQILLGLRKSLHAKGTWCPPGGHLEYGETNEQAVIRETKEETGMDISAHDLHFIGVTNDFFSESGKHYITLHYACYKYSGTPQVTEPEKCEKWCWFKADGLPEKMMLPNMNLLQQNPDILNG